MNVGNWTECGKFPNMLVEEVSLHVSSSMPRMEGGTEKSEASWEICYLPEEEIGSYFCYS